MPEDNKIPWIEAIHEVQEEVSKFANPYYGGPYRREEINYWECILEWLYQDREERKIGSCLDIGCAYGTLAVFCREFYQCDVYCTDFMSHLLSAPLADKHGLKFRVNNIELDPFPWDQKFDTIIFTEILEHLNFHPLPTLRKIKGLLGAKGRLYLSTPDAKYYGKVTKYYQRLADMPQPQKGLPIVDAHVYVYPENELLDLLGEAGFTVEKFQYTPAHHFNLMLSGRE
ncbi:class I SAM-dependent methyltransferase [Candidatus Formimonas warabiya]|uniref:Class I SAM-dependent methyltransferase n=1 Tax=Formimonas warabiya TaxID=1761012 RepID=A0A3G1KSG4_FORW1|nr:class I SAM-dependent methyltransferase [Candidatus Formimonas warabiya]ATW25391.1 hypothetical protein DCMF_11965 [Candidatus Formimonas warabiya]